MKWMESDHLSLYKHIMKKIKVLEVINGFGYGGIRALIMNYLQFIDKSRFDVDIYAFGCDSSPFEDEVRKLGFHIYFEPQNNVRNIPCFVKQLYLFMKEHGPYDVVHAHNNLVSAWVLLAAKMAKVPIRLPHSHSTEHFGTSKVQNLYSYARRYLLKLLATKNLACGRLAGETMYGKNANFDIIANGISVNRFINRDEKIIKSLRDKFYIPEGVRVYANVTRLDTQKNHPFAVEVFNEIHKLDPTAVFVYGGVIPKIACTQNQVEERIKQYKLENYCRFTGPLMNVEQLYHLSDVWIYCSAFEGLPFGPIELQAAGVPVLVSDVITKEIDLGLGLIESLSLNDSPRLWAEKAVTMEKKNLSKETIKAAFRKYNFDIEQNVRHLESIYEGVN